MFDTDKLSALDSLMEAQKIAFAPIIFQTAHLLREWGIFELLHKNKENGMSIKEIAQAVDISEYGIKVLCESGYSMGALKLENDRYYLTRIGFFLQYDEMTNANFNYNQDVNYLGLFDLGDSIKKSKPVGLQNTFNKNWGTLKRPSRAGLDLTIFTQMQHSIRLLSSWQSAL